jgi:hypothetical protein
MLNGIKKTVDKDRDKKMKYRGAFIGSHVRQKSVSASYLKTAFDRRPVDA